MKNNFTAFFKNKGMMAPMGEKAHRNFKQKKNMFHNDERAHFYCVGHSFKNIDTHTLFGFVFDKKSDKKVPTRYLGLQRDFFDFTDELENLLEDIKKLNSHYVHKFDAINTIHINAKLLQFLRESFEVACLLTYLGYSKKTLTEYYSNEQTQERQFVYFLLEKFFADKMSFGELRLRFENHSISEIIEQILFTEVEEDYKWKLAGQHTVFKIKKGKYLSFLACLFLMSMQLYKNEANRLVPKIKGFKRTDDDAFRSKRNIFSFFSKKFNSHDIGNEQKNLLKFRDIIQSLNLYPTAWDKYLGVETEFSEMSKTLVNAIVEMEIESFFKGDINEIEGLDRDRFLLYFKHEFFSEFYDKKEIENQYTEAGFSKDEISRFREEMLNSSDELKNLFQKLQKLKTSGRRDFDKISKLERQIVRKRKEPHPELEKLKRKIKAKQFLGSYGRGQERFLEIAIRFFAETNYFGKNAKFKMYKFYTIDEQASYLRKIKPKLTKKKLDSLRYHQGKLVQYRKYRDHIQTYPDWDTPFVKEHNSVKVKLKLKFTNGGETKTLSKKVTIQRDLMVYFLEDALYNREGGADSLEGRGQRLLQSYYEFYMTEFNQAIETLRNSKQISVEEKTRFSKILPKRLLHHYCPPIVDNNSVYTPEKFILEETYQAEDRYNRLLEQAKSLNLEDYFLKKNKGKQFKLRFIRKVWHLMYFKKIYSERVQSLGHHKSLHISKEEFKDFRRWSFGFEEIPQYKDQLERLLASKGFFQNEEFKKMFHQGDSLESWCQMSKKTFQNWLKQGGEKISPKTNKYKLEDYEALFNVETLYINVSHFISFLEKQGKIKRDQKNYLVYGALKNIPQLIPAYYYKDKLPYEERKKHSKLFNELKKNKLEDALLYEIAFHYLNLERGMIQPEKTSVKQILKQNIRFEIKDNANRHLNTLMVPFHQIDNFIELIAQKSPKDMEYGINFLDEIYAYLDKAKDEKEIRFIVDKRDAKGYRKIDVKQISFDDLHKIYSHIMDDAFKFTTVMMALEEYYVLKNKLTAEDKTWINFDEITAIRPYVKTNARDKAFRFEIPERSYAEEIKVMEEKFIQQEIMPHNYKNVEDLPPHAVKLATVFLKTHHNHYFDRTISDKRERAEKAKQKYFKNLMKQGD